MFHFKKFDLEHDKSTLKIGTDALLLACLTNTDNANSVLDIGCGCGVISFCLAQKISENQNLANLVGIDIDSDSIAESKENAKMFSLLPYECFDFRNVSLQDFATNYDSKFDLIVSNPPFFSNNLKPTDKNRLKSKHSDGNLSFVEIVEYSDKLLAQNGRLSVVLPKQESEIFLNKASEIFFLTKQTEIYPTTSKPVSRVVMEFSRNYSDTIVKYLTIRDLDLTYTAEYLKLVEDFLIIKQSNLIK